ncbi:hypothetical protein I3271_05390 [Photobacterium leiognathi]|uniref:hypothetical protein n=1 Tax=Photobacterium leiognathi TaxID=553611 RepID=UPI001EDE627D|nr:hypothetical protein [Photobacterium leiognathi]MCG3884114.1 hypothetical protein [Photobacterium leiognathi]
MLDTIQSTERVLELAVFIVVNEDKKVNWCDSADSVKEKLFSYVNDRDLFEARESLDNCDIEIVYLVLRDYLKTTDKTLISFESVAKYFGIEVTKDCTFKPSPSVKVKLFKCGNLSSLSKATGIPIQTLRDWFVSKKIQFHAVMLFLKED